MFRLLYVSSSSQRLKKDELMAILAKARQKNAALGVTGMLLYKDGNFMQVLEGEEPAVRAVFDSVKNDKRHHGVIVLFEKPVPDRLFSDWSMGFREVSDADIRDTPGFAQFQDRDFLSTQVRNDPSGCIDLLKFFAEGR